MASIFDRIAAGANRLANAWNAFRDDDEQRNNFAPQYGAGYGVTPTRRRFTGSNERSIISAMYMRLAIDVSAIDMRHVRLDSDGRYLEDIKSSLQECLTLEANVDQGARHFKQDAAMAMFDKGVVALVPIDTTANPNMTGSFDVNSIRVGEIVTFYPRHVKVNVWNDMVGRYQEIIVPKISTPIIENPLYAVMNEPNSTLQRLIRKLNILDAIDEASGSGKLDIIIQLPYVLKTEAKKEEAEKRLKSIEMQLTGSRHGIAYTDATEKIIQLNRPVENNIMAQIEFLTKMLYGQIGLTESIFTGSATEEEMLNYYNRTIEPILAAFTQAMRRTLLTKTARTQGQSIVTFRDPFKLVPIAQVAEIADKFTRNEIVTGNEMRGFIGMKPSSDPKADKLINSNMPQPPDSSSPPNENLV